MQIQHFALVSIAFFAIIHLAWLPRLEKRIRAERDLGAIRLVAMVGVLSVARTAALLAAISSGAIVAFVLWMSLSGGVTSQQLTSGIESLRILKSQVTAIAPVAAVFVLLFLTIVLMLLVRSSSKRRVEKVFQERMEGEAERLNEEFKEGKWEDLPPTKQMEELDKYVLMGRHQLSATEDPTEHAAIMGKLSQLMQLRFIVDRARRMKVQADPDDLIPPVPRTWRARLGTLFVSEGVTRSLVGGKRTLFLVGLLLLVPCLVGAQSGALGAAIENRIVELDELSVSASEAEAELLWASVASSALQDPQAEASDEEVLDTLAQAFESQFADSQDDSAAVQSVRVGSHSARQRILEVGAATNRVGVSSLSDATDLQPVQREVLSAAQPGSSKKGPRTELGRKVRERFREISVKDPGKWAALKAGARDAVGSFQRPARVRDVSRLAISEIFGVALGDASLGTGELGQAALAMREQFDVRSLERAYNIRFDRFASSIARGDGMREAARVAFVENPGSPSFPRKRYNQSPFEAAEPVIQRAGIGDLMTEHPPTLFAAEQDVMRVQKVADLIEELSQHVPHRPNLTDSMNSFDDIFPGQLGADQRTPKANLDSRFRRKWQALATGTPGGSPIDGPVGSGSDGFPTPGGGNGRSSKVHSSTQSASPHTAFRRSRSFGGLRGFSRIGGVLLGATPDALEPRVRVTDLHWKTTGSFVVLDLTFDDGRHLERGPFHASIVNQALLYAADGRPITVTMITAWPLAELRILLHPALVDTSLGCHASQLDRLVDTATAKDLVKHAAAKRVQWHGDLYGRAWALRALLISESDPAGRLSDADQQFVISEFNRYRSALGPDTLSQLKSTSSADFSEEHSPLSKKTEFFEEELTEVVRGCVPQADYEAFDECVLRNVRPTERWRSPPPQFEVWSGVRDRDYAIDRDLSFLAVTPNESDLAALPFEFMLQVAFTTVPEHLGSDAEPASYQDQHPWEFPGIRDHIERKVASHLTTSTSDQRTIGWMREFTVLQRFFRLMLDGQLGDEPPVEGLVALAQETASAVRSRPTPRWNYGPGLIEKAYARQLAQLLPLLDLFPTSDPEESSWARALRSGGEACLGWMEGQTTVDISRIPEDEWSARCALFGGQFAAPQGTGPSQSQFHGLATAMNRFSAEATYARRIRHALDVDTEQQALATSSCEAP